jgi:hypothetical protein
MEQQKPVLEGIHKTSIINIRNLRSHETPDGEFFDRHDPKPLRVTFQNSQETHETNR